MYPLIVSLGGIFDHEKTAPGFPRAAKNIDSFSIFRHTLIEGFITLREASKLTATCAGATLLGGFLFFMSYHHKDWRYPRRFPMLAKCTMVLKSFAAPVATKVSARPGTFREISLSTC